MKKWTKDETVLLIRLYGDNTPHEIHCKYLSYRTIASIKEKIKKLKIANLITNSILTKHSCNENFFNEPNLENCYWAGWIASDGNILKNRLCLRIATYDKQVLLNFKESINSTNTAKDRQTKFKNDIQNYSSEIYIYSESICKKLKEHWNITAKKSLTLRPPKDYITENLALAYIKGYFEGDGCLTINPRGYYNIEFVGTYEVLTWIKNYLDKLYPIDRKESSIRKRKNIYRLAYFGSRAKNIHNVLKNINTKYYLPRKWEKTAYQVAKIERNNKKQQRKEYKKLNPHIDPHINFPLINERF